MIKAIAFDIGGIVIDESSTTSRKLLAQKYGFKAEDFSNFAKKNLDKSFKGWPALEFFQELAKELNIKASPEQLCKDWLELRNKTSKVNNKIKNLIKRLRNNYVVVCFTNTTKLNDKARARIEAYKFFDVLITSTKEKSRKPEKEIYQALIKKLEEKGIKPEETALIDNKPEYLTPAKELGIKTIFYTKYFRLVNELVKLGVRA